MDVNGSSQKTQNSWKFSCRTLCRSCVCSSQVAATDLLTYCCQQPAFSPEETYDFFPEPKERHCMTTSPWMLLAGLAGATVMVASTQPQQPCGPPHLPPSIMKALDTDQDGKLSKSEISNASETLLSLDNNEDGELSQEEVGPPQRKGHHGPDRGHSPPKHAGPQRHHGHHGPPGAGGPAGHHPPPQIVIYCGCASHRPPPPPRRPPHDHAGRPGPPAERPDGPPPRPEPPRANETEE